MTVHDLEEVHLRPEVLVAGEDTGDVHHLGKPDDALPPPEPGEVGCGKHGAAHIEGGCRDAGGEHDQDIERCPRSLGKHVFDPRRSADVRYLVGIGDHRRCAVGKDEPGILRRREERTLDVDVGVDQPGHYVGPRKVVILPPPVVSKANDATVLDRKVHALPGARERVEDLAAGEDGISRFEPPRRRKPGERQAATSRSRMTDVLRSCPTNMVRKTLYDPGSRSTEIA
ncbi:hypothetical protein DSECCO2_505950 [anaerobic digester metagenome]